MDTSICFPIHRFGLAAITTLVFGCASDPVEMEAQYVSPIQYQQFDCEQISAEMGRVSQRTFELFERLYKLREDDEAQTAVGIILFWPALFFLEGGDGPEALEYSRLRGEVDALEQVAREKQCDMSEFEAMREQERKIREAAEEKRRKQQESDPLDY
jgi:hypothetical protein